MVTHQQCRLEVNKGVTHLIIHHIVTVSMEAMDTHRRSLTIISTQNNILDIHLIIRTMKLIHIKLLQKKRDIIHQTLVVRNIHLKHYLRQVDHITRSHLKLRMVNSNPNPHRLVIKVNHALVPTLINSRVKLLIILVQLLEGIIVQPLNTEILLFIRNNMVLTRPVRYHSRIIQVIN